MTKKTIEAYDPMADQENEEIIKQEEGNSDKEKAKKKTLSLKTIIGNDQFYQAFDFSNLPKRAYAGFWLRTLAYLLDLVFINLITSLIFNLSVYRIWGYEAEGLAIDFLKLGIFLAYFTLTTYFFKGQTFGKMLIGLRTVKSKGDNLDSSSLLVRELAGRSIIKIIPILAVFLVFDSKRRHFIDQLCDTVVINENQLKMLVDFQLVN